jgi:hypothetical protein
MPREPCPKCVGQRFCRCPKTRAKNKPAAPWTSPRRQRVQTHNWGQWITGPAGTHAVKMCSRCGMARARRTDA